MSNIIQIQSSYKNEAGDQLILILKVYEGNDEEDYPLNITVSINSMEGEIGHAVYSLPEYNTSKMHERLDLIGDAVYSFCQEHSLGVPYFDEDENRTPIYWIRLAVDTYIRKIK